MVEVAAQGGHGFDIGSATEGVLENRGLYELQGVHLQGVDAGAQSGEREAPEQLFEMAQRVVRPESAQPQGKKKWIGHRTLAGSIVVHAGAAAEPALRD
jgi:hypothetical protein